MKLNMCMLHHYVYYKSGAQLDLEWRLEPILDIFTYLFNFGHRIVWIIPSEENHRVEPFFFGSARVYVTPCLQGTSLLRKIIKKVPNGLREMCLALRTIKREKSNIVIAREDDDFDTLIGAYIKRRYQIPFVFIQINTLEMEREIYKIEQNKPRLLYRLIANIHTLLKVYTMKQADLILVPTRWFKDHLIERGIPESKIVPFTSSVDINLFSNRDGTTIRNKYHLGYSEVIVYVGIMGKARYLNVLIQAFLNVKKEKKSAKLLMVGQGTDEENLKRLATELGVGDDVIFTGQIPHSEVQNFIAAADVGVSPVPPLSFYKVSTPIKLFEYMAMAKPVVANDEILEHKEVLEESGAGILVSYTPEAFAEAIIELLDNTEKASEMGRRGREWVIKHRTYEIIARRIEQRCLSIVKQKSDSI